MVVYIKEEANLYHGGSQWTLPQMYEDSLRAEASWECYRKINNITVDSCPRSGEFRYEKQYEKHIFQTWPAKYDWKSFDHYEDCKSVKTQLDDLALWLRYKDRFGQFWVDCPAVHCHAPLA